MLMCYRCGIVLCIIATNTGIYHEPFLWFCSCSGTLKVERAVPLDGQAARLPGKKGDARCSGASERGARQEGERSRLPVRPVPDPGSGTRLDVKVLEILFGSPRRDWSTFRVLLHALTAHCRQVAIGPSKRQCKRVAGL